MAGLEELELALHVQWPMWDWDERLRLRSGLETVVLPQIEQLGCLRLHHFNVDFTRVILKEMKWTRQPFDEEVRQECTGADQDDGTTA
jgi:hypothetical protein